MGVVTLTRLAKASNVGRCASSRSSVIAFRWRAKRRQRVDGRQLQLPGFALGLLEQQTKFLRSTVRIAGGTGIRHNHDGSRIARMLSPGESVTP